MHDEKHLAIFAIVRYTVAMISESIVVLIEVYAARQRHTVGTVSTYAAGSGDFYVRLKHGHDLTTRRAERVIQWLSDHWPSDLDWPAEIPRPPRSAEAKKGAAA